MADDVVTLWQDLRYGLRTFREHPGITTLLVLFIVLTIVFNAAILNWVESDWLLPSREMERKSRIVIIELVDPPPEDIHVSFMAI